MKKMIISMLVIMLILILVMSFTIVSSKDNYVKIPEYNHSLTKAICNSENFCQDYEIFCKDQKVIGMSPITGAAVQFSVDWEDPRDEEMRNKLC